MVQAIPAGYPRVTPYLHIDGAAAAIDFYTKVLGATERMRMPAPGGKVGHAEVMIGDSVIMLADESPEMNVLSPARVGGTPVGIHVYVSDVDAVHAAALAAGATEISPPQDQFYGDRSAQFTDPFGHRWSIATHVEDVEPAEMMRRMQELTGS